MIKSSDVKNKVEIRRANIGDVRAIYETFLRRLNLIRSIIREKPMK